MDRQQRPADGGGKAGDPQGAGRFGVRIEIEPCGVDRRQDGDGMSASRRPAGVSRTRRPSGSIRLLPRSRDSAAICCDTVDVVTESCSATSCMEPSLASSRRNNNRLVSMLKLSTIHE